MLTVKQLIALINNHKQHYTIAFKDVEKFVGALQKKYDDLESVIVRGDGDYFPIKEKFNTAIRFLIENYSHIAEIAVLEKKIDEIKDCITEFIKFSNQ